MLVDTHSHSYLCKHSENVNPIAYAKALLEFGFSPIVFCDHNPFPGDSYDFIHRMSISELQIFDQLYEKQKLADTAVLKYLEVDWAVLNNDLSIQFVQKYLTQYDCVLGSIHFNDESEVHFIENMSWQQFFEFYRMQWTLMVDTNLFQIATHFDFFRVYHSATRQLSQTTEGRTIIDDFVVSVLSSRIDKIVIEINTAAQRYSDECGYALYSFPSRDVIKRLARLGAKFTIATDTHWLRQVGQSYGETMEFLAECQVTQLHFVQQKQIVPYSLEIARKRLNAIDQVLLSRLSEEYKLQ